MKNQSDTPGERVSHQAPEGPGAVPPAAGERAPSPVLRALAGSRGRVRFYAPLMGPWRRAGDDLEPR
mgnify:CR=1 FL=1